MEPRLLIHRLAIMDLATAQAIIQSETENENGFLYRFAVHNAFLSENWQQLQAAIHTFAEALSDSETNLDRRTAGDLHYLTLVLTMASEVLQARGEPNIPLEAAISALWEYNHKIFTVPENRDRKPRRREDSHA
jgi:hypothetical protein